MVLYRLGPHIFFSEWLSTPGNLEFVLSSRSLFRELLAQAGIIQIHEDFWVRLEGSKEWRLVSSLRPGKYKCVEIGKGSRMRGYVVVHEWIDKKRGGVERWYLQTNVGDTKGFIVGMYGKRMQIEEGFRDLKRVMDWEEYTARVPKAEYMEKCTVISSLSYAIQVSLGRYEEVGKVEARRSGWLAGGMRC